MVKQIIKEAMDQNPLGLKEAVEAELQSRIILAIEAKVKKMKEEDDEEEMDDEEDMDDEEEMDDEEDMDDEEEMDDKEDDLEEVNVMRKMSPAKMAKLQKARLGAAVAKSATKKK
jgi:hypothetical protein